MRVLEQGTITSFAQALGIPPSQGGHIRKAIDKPGKAVSGWVFGLVQNLETDLRGDIRVAPTSVDPKTWDGALTPETLSNAFLQSLRTRFSQYPDGARVRMDDLLREEFPLGRMVREIDGRTGFVPYPGNVPYGTGGIKQFARVVELANHTGLSKVISGKQQHTKGWMAWRPQPARAPLCEPNSVVGERPAPFNIHTGEHTPLFQDNRQPCSARTVCRGVDVVAQEPIPAPPAQAASPLDCSFELSTAIYNCLCCQFPRIPEAVMEQLVGTGTFEQGFHQCQEYEQTQGARACHALDQAPMYHQTPSAIQLAQDGAPTPKRPRTDEH